MFVSSFRYSHRGSSTLREPAVFMAVIIGARYGKIRENANAKKVDIMDNVWYCPHTE
jgi:hypothetical protein